MKIESLKQIAESQDDEKTTILNAISRDDKILLQRLALTISAISDKMEFILDKYDVEPFCALAMFIETGEAEYNEIYVSNEISH